MPWSEAMKGSIDRAEGVCGLQVLHMEGFVCSRALSCGRSDTTQERPELDLQP